MNLENTNLGPWSIERELVEAIKSELPSGRIILEFGSGGGTDVLLEKYNVISIEHNMEFVYQRANNHACVHAPLDGNWYSRQVVGDTLKMKHDLILVDGPPRENRRGILDNLDLFNESKALVMFDDMDRSLDRDVMIIFCNRLNYSYQIIDGLQKQFAICKKMDEREMTGNQIKIEQRKTINGFLSQTILNELYKRCSNQNYVDLLINLHFGILSVCSLDLDSFGKTIRSLKNGIDRRKLTSFPKKHFIEVSIDYNASTKRQISRLYNMLFEATGKNLGFPWIKEWMTMCSRIIGNNESSFDKTEELFLMVNNHFEIGDDQLLRVLDYIQRRLRK